MEKKVFFIICIISAFTCFESDLFDITKLKTYPKQGEKIIDDPLIFFHRNKINDLQQKTKKISCMILIRSIVLKISTKAQIAEIINTLLHNAGLNPDVDRDYFDIKELVYNNLLEYTSKVCIERINSESTVSKLTPKNAYNLSDDEEIFMMGIIHSFTFNMEQLKRDNSKTDL